MASLEPTESPVQGDASLLTLHIVSPAIDGHRLTLRNTEKSTTIAQLKERIKDNIPEHPLPEQQRLIYQGRPLLDNNATLETVLGAETLRTTTDCTIHMALRPSILNSHPVSGVGAPSRHSVREQQPNEATAGGERRPRNEAGELTAASLNAAAAGVHTPINLPPVGHSPFPLPSGPQFNTTRFLAPGPPGGVFAQPTQIPQANLQHIFAQQQILEQQIQHLTAAQQRLRMQQEQLQSADNNTPQNEPQPASQSQNSGQPTIPAHVNGNNGNHATGFVQHGQVPGHGSWRISVEQHIGQTTIRRPSSGPPSGFPHPPTTALNTNSPQPHMFPAPSNAPQQQFHLPPHFNLPQPPNMFPSIRPPFPPRLPNRSSARAGPATTPAFPNQLYLVSGPGGYQALLIPPDGPVALTANFLLPIVPTRTSPNIAPHGPGSQPQPPGAHTLPGAAAHPNNPDQAQAQAQAQADEPQADLLRILLPLGGHLWLLIRLLGFVYLFAGGATWSRTLLMSGIALLVWFAQAGWLTPLYRAVIEPVRQHVEELVQVQGAGGGAGGADAGPHQPPGQDAAADPRPTATGAQPHPQPADMRRRTAMDAAGAAPVMPEQLATRLIGEREAREASAFRTVLRRWERSVALFLTSLVPGWGEQHVRLQTEADAARARREAENEVARRRERELEQERSQAERDGQADGGEAALDESENGNRGAETAVAAVGAE